MNAVELRRHLLDDELARLSRAGHGAEAALLPILDRLADKERLFDLTKSQRQKAAYRAARLLAVPPSPTASIRAAMAKGTWRERAAAASVRGGHALRPVGSLRGQPATDELKAGLDGVAVSRALATAIREVASPALMGSQMRLKGEAAAALRHEKDGAAVWERALAPLLREFAWNAQGAGATRREAALEALTAAAVLTGQARQGDHDGLPSLLGSAARTIMRARKAITLEAQAIRRLSQELAGHNDVRLELWGGLESGEIRLLGGAAAVAVFGKGAVHRQAAPQAHAFDGRLLPESWRMRFAHLTAAEAAGELMRMASDPRLNDDARASADLAAEAAAAHPGASRVSFAEALGLEAPELRLDAMRQGRMFRAAPRGKRLARLLCRGKYGRLLRCRAVADADGAMIGYLAFDPFSREIGGRPLFAAYGLDGKRQGYAWADEPAYWRAGRPEQGFVTAPDSIPL